MNVYLINTCSAHGPLNEVWKGGYPLSRLGPLSCVVLILILSLIPTTHCLADPTVLETVVVTATRTEMKLQDVSASVTVLTKKEIAQSAALTLDDLLRQIPGFNTYLRSSSLVTAPQQDPEAQGVTLRGIGPGGASRALVLLDGIPVNDPFGGWLYWGEIPLDNIERIEVVKGGSSNLWGSFALAGVINIITTVPEKRTIQAKVSGGNLGTTDDVFSFSDVNGPFRISLQGNFLRTNGYNIVAPNQRGSIDGASGSERGAFNGHINYSVSPNSSLYLRGSYYSEARNNGTLLRTSSADRGFIAAGGRLKTANGGLWQLDVFSHLTTFNEQYSLVNMPRTSEVLAQVQQVPSKDIGGSLTWSQPFLADHLLTVGSDFRLINGETRDVFPGTPNINSTTRLSKGQQNFYGVFVQNIYTPNPKTQFNLGVRFDHYEIFEGSITDSATTPTVLAIPNQSRNVINPKASFRYKILEALAVRGAAYRAFRAPTLSEMTRESSVESLRFLPNGSLNPEILEGGELGFDYSGLPGLMGRVTAFMSNLKDVITTVGDEDERTLVNLKLARTIGVELDLTYRLTPQLNLEGSYLYSQAKIIDAPQDRTLEGKRLTQVPWQSGTIGVRYNNPTVLNFLAQVRLEGLKYEDSDNMDKLRGFAVVDLTVSKPIPRISILSKPKSGEIFLSVRNLFNRQYDVDTGGGILKIGTPFMVVGGVKLQF